MTFSAKIEAYLYGVEPQLLIQRTVSEDDEQQINFVVIRDRRFRKHYFRLQQRKDGRWVVPLKNTDSFRHCVEEASGILGEANGMHRYAYPRDEIYLRMLDEMKPFFASQGVRL